MEDLDVVLNEFYKDKRDDSEEDNCCDKVRDQSQKHHRPHRVTITEDIISKIKERRTAQLSLKAIPTTRKFLGVLQGDENLQMQMNRLQALLIEREKASRRHAIKTVENLLLAEGWPSSQCLPSNILNKVKGFICVEGCVRAAVLKMKYHFQSSEYSEQIDVLTEFAAEIIEDVERSFKMWRKKLSSFTSAQSPPIHVFLANFHLEVAKTCSAFFHKWDGDFTKLHEGLSHILQYDDFVQTAFSPVNIPRHITLFHSLSIAYPRIVIGAISFFKINLLQLIATAQGDKFSSSNFSDNDNHGDHVGCDKDREDETSENDNTLTSEDVDYQFAQLLWKPAFSGSPNNLFGQPVVSELITLFLRTWLPIIQQCISSPVYPGAKTALLEVKEGFLKWFDKLTTELTTPSSSSSVWNTTLSSFTTSQSTTTSATSSTSAQISAPKGSNDELERRSKIASLSTHLFVCLKTINQLEIKTSSTKGTTPQKDRIGFTSPSNNQNGRGIRNGDSVDNEDKLRLLDWVDGLLQRCEQLMDVAINLLGKCLSAGVCRRLDALCSLLSSSSFVPGSEIEGCQVVSSFATKTMQQLVQTSVGPVPLHLITLQANSMVGEALLQWLHDEFVNCSNAGDKMTAEARHTILKTVKGVFAFIQKTFSLPPSSLSHVLAVIECGPLHTYLQLTPSLARDCADSLTILTLPPDDAKRIRATGNMECALEELNVGLDASAVRYFFQPA
eukprot:m.175946 g.175946  ORF g.175946 m.175946 type:complete len:728 (-) comp13526_c0_seq3:4004-6187(-)